MRPEDAVQSAIVAYVRTVAPSVLLYAVPNASRRVGPTGKAANAVPGLMPGVFDLAMVLPDGRAAFLEVKAGRGKLSKVQEWFQAILVKRGVPYAVVRSIDDARAALAQWGVSTKEAIWHG